MLTAARSLTLATGGTVMKPNTAAWLVCMPGRRTSKYSLEIDTEYVKTCNHGTASYLIMDDDHLTGLCVVHLCSGFLLSGGSPINLKRLSFRRDIR
ncbi:hypothetical protein FOXB_00637 [Fusarium oxysporum f. sp. conglutinans Fo5176]|uniref:Uncharacterized protein n=1 Tax=Fusarium oxysporum (strain Fo5176) TaxID=660025 RepID=F9F2L3_FUSOF|nr:hypothetical protein FOXB_00637 [Fusarium oxysporum f. sp. conglutinans Fo5176]